MHRNEWDLPADSSATARTCQTNDAALLEEARQRRAKHLARLVSRPARLSAILIGTASTLAAIALIAAYVMLLAHVGVSVSILSLFAVLLAATLSSIAGFAFSAICGVMLLQIMTDPVHVVEIMMVCSIAIQSLSVAVLWRDIDWRGLPPFLVGGAAGLPFGVGLLLHVRDTGFREAVGVLLIVYAAYALLRPPLTITSGGRIADAGAGFLGGITGGLTAFPGATVTAWCGMKGWDKRRQRGIYQPFILVMQILALGLMGLMRASGGVHMPDLSPLQFVPTALLGTWLGLSIFRRISDRSFTVTVNALLLVSGAGLLV